MSRSAGWTAILLLAMPVACGPAPAKEPWPAEIWPALTPEAQGLHAALLLPVIRNGFAVHEAFYKWDYDTPFRKIAQSPGPYNYDDPDWHPYYLRGGLHTLQSVSKSVTSALIGIAITRGELPGAGRGRSRRRTSSRCDRTSNGTSGRRTTRTPATPAR